MVDQEKRKIYSLDIQNVTKAFSRKTLQKGGYTTLKSLLLNPLKHEKVANHDNIYAIKNLTLQIPRGQAVGIIGRNGAGKSTLLKLISGIYQPTSGSIKVNGKIAALIELGAGFHPDFSGKENIYLGGAMHGMTRAEIDKVYDDIVEFSELEEYIDAPIRTYSSGMFMRLGFSLAIHTSPDILIVDEVLAVGDASFNAKCKDRLFDIKKNGTTLLLVSHDLTAIKEWCDEALWIEKGEVKSRGIPEEVIDEYLNDVNIKDGKKIKEHNDKSSNTDKQNKRVAINLLEQCATNSDNGGNENLVVISNVKCLNKDNDENYAYKINDVLKLSFDYELVQALDNINFEIKINRSDGLLVSESNTKLEGVNVNLNKNKGTVIYDIKDLTLLPARYFISIAVRKKDNSLCYLNNKAINFLVRANGRNSGVVLLEHEWSFR